MYKKEIVILVIDDEKSWREKIKKGLKEAAKKYKELSLKFELVERGEEALEKLGKTGNIQGVIVDWWLYEPHQKGKEQEVCKHELIDKIKKLRPEIPICVLTQGKETPVEDLYYSYKEGVDYKALLTKILEKDSRRGCALKERAEMPFFEALEEYTKNKPFAFHTTAGSGEALKQFPWMEDFYNFYKEKCFEIDTSSAMYPLDSLFYPKRSLKKAQDLSAKAFGAGRTYFVVGGTSAANRILIQGVLRPGDKVIVERACHKSVHHGLILTGVKPIYLKNRINKEYGIYGPVNTEDIKTSIDTHSDAQLLILTNCSFDGLVYKNLKDIIDYAHKKGIKVMVDEAWFAFAYFHPKFRKYSGMNCGADFVTQSTHKTLSAFRQGSMIHIHKDALEEFDEHSFLESYFMHTTTSPNYAILLSLDAARRQASIQGFDLIGKITHWAEDLREYLKDYLNFLTPEDLFPNDDEDIDQVSIKLLIDISKTKMVGREFVKELFDKGIQVNKYTFNTVLINLHIVCTITAKENLKTILKSCVEEIREDLNKKEKCPQLPDFSDLKYEMPRDAFYENNVEEKGIKEIEDRKFIAANLIVPYPPGIPLLVPGEIITGEIIEYISQLKELEYEVHGIREDKLRVIKDEQNNWNNR